MKQRPQNEYNNQTTQSTLITDTTEEGNFIGSNGIYEKATIFQWFEEGSEWLLLKPHVT